MPINPDAIYLERAQELRNPDGWHYADELGYSAAALARAAAHLTHRIGTEQPLPAAGSKPR